MVELLDVAPSDVELQVVCSSEYISNIFLFFIESWARREWTSLPESLPVRLHTLKCAYYRMALHHKAVQWSSCHVEESLELQGRAQPVAVSSQLLLPKEQQAPPLEEV